MKLTPEQYNFNAGEISPLMYGRVDLQKYHYGCKTLQNMLIWIQGPSFRRPGTEYIAEVKDSGDDTRVIPFIYSISDAYIIEMGDKYFRFYRAGGQIADNGSPYEIATVLESSELFEVHYDQVEDLMYFAHESHPHQKLIRSGHADWAIDDAAFEGGPFLPENDEDTTITPSGTSGSITLTASDSIFNANHVGALWQITQDRESTNVNSSFSTTGTSSTLAVEKGTSVKVTTHGEWTGTLSVERSYDDGTNWDEVFSIDVASDDNMLETFEETIDDALYRLNMSAHTTGTCRYTMNVESYEWHGIVEITAYSSATSVTATVIKTLQSTNPTTKWAEGAWSDDEGYPTCLTFFQQRLWLASKVHKSPRIFGSKDFEFEDFLEGSEDNDPLNFYLSSARSNGIVWLATGQNIIIGTSEQSSSVQPVMVDGGIQTLGGEGGAGAITPTNFESSKLSGNTILFVGREGNKIFQISNSVEVANYIDIEEISILAEHIVKPDIVQIAFQQRPIPILWMVRSDGVLVSMTYSKVHKVAAFATHPMTNGSVESVAVIPNATTKQDEVWLIVNRRIEGSPKKYVERLREIDLEPDEVEDCWYLDCALLYDDTATTTITGLDHLEGQTVAALADGYYVPDLVVSGGSATLPFSASKVLVGLPYDSQLETLDLQFSLNIGTTKGMKIRISGVNVDFYKSGSGAQVGIDEDNLRTFDFAQPTDSVNKPVPLYSGVWPPDEREMSLESKYKKESSIIIKQSLPLPLVVRSIIPNVVIGE